MAPSLGYLQALSPADTTSGRLAASLDPAEPISDDVVDGQPHGACVRPERLPAEPAVEMSRIRLGPRADVVYELALRAG